MAHWDSLYIYYISGTGNARLSSEWVAEEFRKNGMRASVHQIDRLENISMPAANEKPLIGFAFPTHGFNAAPIMLRFIAGFPRGYGKEVFLLNTRAGMKLSRIFMPGITGLALILPAFLLYLKGYRCIGFRPVDLPSNWIPLHPGLRTKVIESIITHWQPVVRKFAGKLISGKKVYRGLFSLPLDLLVSPIAAGYYIGGRFFLSKTFIANSNCNNCGICIKECPTASIILVNNRPYWKLTCESCMRCMNLCPRKAIEAAHGIAAGMIFLFSLANGWLLMTIAGKLGIAEGALWWKILTQFIGIGVMVAVATVVYLAVHYAMAFKPIRWLARFTSLTTIPGWRRYRYLKNKRQ
jgi:Pyruvate/2-oxoacid:ferredoxin oxidoreductase delta subunit